MCPPAPLPAPSRFPRLGNDGDDGDDVRAKVPNRRHAPTFRQRDHHERTTRLRRMGMPDNSEPPARRRRGRNLSAMAAVLFLKPVLTGNSREEGLSQ